jgi:hypothetical protein
MVLGDSDFVIVECDRCGHQYMYDEECLTLYLDANDLSRTWLNAGSDVPPCLGCGRTDWDWESLDADSPRAVDGPWAWAR